MEIGDRRHVSSIRFFLLVRGGNIGSLPLPILFARPIGTSPLWRICSFIETKAARIFHCAPFCLFAVHPWDYARQSNEPSKQVGQGNQKRLWILRFWIFSFRNVALRVEFSTRSNEIFSIYIYIFLLLVKIRYAPHRMFFSFPFLSFFNEKL